MQKLMDMGVNSNIILWIKSFLTNRKQYVQFKDSCSSMLVTNTGAPQGCVLSALLFTLYTSDCQNFSDKCTVIKYADDTVIVGLIDRNVDICDTNCYFDAIVNFKSWCDQNFLNLNVKKTKEMVIDFSRKSQSYTPVTIDDENVEVVTEYKYLGFTIDDKLTGSSHVKKMYKKANQRMFFLRKLKRISVDNLILELFYKSIIQSVLSYCLVCWFGNTCRKDRNLINRIMKSASRMGVMCSFLDMIYDDLVSSKLLKIQDNSLHPLYDCFVSSSSARLRSIFCRTERYKNSFVPTAIRKFNNSVVERFNIK